MAPQGNNSREHEPQDDPLLDESYYSEIVIRDWIIDDPEQKNVALTLWYTFLSQVGRSVWSNSVLTTFVFLVKHNNAEAVGYLTAVMGLCQLVVSFPAGHVSDTYRRDALLQSGAVLGVLAIAVTVAACYYEDYKYMVLALAIWGSCFGVANTALTALFADSIPDGERSYYFTQRSILRTVGSIAGPAVALVMFAILGDNWTVRDCAIVMAVGQIICFPAVVLLWFFQDVQDDCDDDEHCAENGNEAHNDYEAPLLTGEIDNEKDSENQERAPDPGNDEEEALIEIDGEVETSSSDDEPINVVCNGCCLPRNRVIPVFIAVADLTAGLGAGMSIRYFPLFFVDNLNLGPVKVQVLYVVGPLVQTVLMKLSQKLAISYGRCKVTVLFKWIGIALMFTMIAAYSVLHAPTWLVCVIYVLRTGFINSCGALTRSMLMDNVPSHERGKWSALESVNMFSWSGSAALGGYLVGILGIIPLFAITASMHFFSSLIVMTLFGVDTKESPERRTTAAESR